QRDGQGPQSRLHHLGGVTLHRVGECVRRPCYVVESSPRSGGSRVQRVQRVTHVLCLRTEQLDSKRTTLDRVFHVTESVESLTQSVLSGFSTFTHLLEELFGVQPKRFPRRTDPVGPRDRFDTELLESVSNDVDVTSTRVDTLDHKTHGVSTRQTQVAELSSVLFDRGKQVVTQSSGNLLHSSGDQVHTRLSVRYQTRGEHLTDSTGRLIDVHVERRSESQSRLCHRLEFSVRSVPHPLDRGDDRTGSVGDFLHGATETGSIDRTS